MESQEFTRNKRHHRADRHEHDSSEFGRKGRDFGRHARHGWERHADDDGTNTMNPGSAQRATEETDTNEPQCHKRHRRHEGRRHHGERSESVMRAGKRFGRRAAQAAGAPQLIEEIEVRRIVRRYAVAESTDEGKGRRHGGRHDIGHRAGRSARQGWQDRRSEA